MAKRYYGEACALSTVSNMYFIKISFIIILFDISKTYYTTNGSYLTNAKPFVCVKQKLWAFFDGTPPLLNFRRHATNILKDKKCWKCIRNENVFSKSKCVSLLVSHKNIVIFDDKKEIPHILCSILCSILFCSNAEK